MPEKKEKLTLIQMLRGFAAILVIIHHGSSTVSNFIGEIFRQGWIGVDFFFVLSGFIIFYIHYKDFGKKEKVKEFYLKRFIRIYPIYWVVTIGVVGLFLLAPSLGSVDFSIGNVIKSFFLFPQTDSPIVVVGWSLVYEVLFYFVFSLFIFLKPKYSYLLAVVWITGIAINSTGFTFLGDNFYLNFIFHNYHIEFLLGCATAYITLKTKVKYKGILMALGIFGFVFGWGLLIQGVIERYSTESMLVIGLSCSLIVLSAVSIDLEIQPKVPKVFLLIGDASYSIYLTHIYFLIILFKINGNLNIFNSMTLIIVIPTLTILLGIVFHLVIEKPLLKYLNILVKRKRQNVSNKKLFGETFSQ